ncbi:MAG TPA: Tim44/TimA family putative adaptor protein [Magnetospirillaceae bacterium]|jgi:predicted lipid-binding transport protein (Tim44 family)
MGSNYVDVVVFALIAIFVGLRLRSVLGRRTGNEPPPSQFRPFNGAGQNDSANGPNGPGGVVTPLRPGNGPGNGPIIEGTAIPAADPVAAGMARIQALDPTIVADGFAEGARGAFGMILDAFAKGDEPTLRPLLSDDVFQNFVHVIRQRREAGEICENQLVHIASAEIVEADMAGKMARITVRFVSQQVIAVKDAQGQVVEGDPAKPVQVTDLWTFARDPRSRDPNWILVATRSQDE